MVAVNPSDPDLGEYRALIQDLKNDRAAFELSLYGIESEHLQVMSNIERLEAWLEAITREHAVNPSVFTSTIVESVGTSWNNPPEIGGSLRIEPSSSGRLSLVSSGSMLDERQLSNKPEEICEGIGLARLRQTFHVFGRFFQVVRRRYPKLCAEALLAGD